MSTETQTTTLPEAVVAALVVHDEAKAAYLVQLEPLVTLGKRLEKHRATGRAARHESETAGSEWRAAFRAADGELTPEVLKAKREELDKRELAESYEQLAAELEPSYQMAQLDVCDARELYVRAWNKAAALYEGHRFATASAAMFATDQGQAWLRLIQEQKARHFNDVVADGIGNSFRASGQAERDEAARERFKGALAKLVETAAASSRPAEADPQAQALQMLPVTVYELDGREASSPASRHQKRANLKALLEEQNDQRSA